MATTHSKDLDITTWANVCEEVTEKPINDFIRKWYEGNIWLDDRIVKVVNRGNIAGVYRLDLDFKRSDKIQTVLPVLVTDKDNQSIVFEVKPNEKEAVIRTNSVPANIEIDPLSFLPLLCLAERNNNSAIILAKELVNQERWTEVQNVLGMAKINSGQDSAELNYLFALAEMKLAHYNEAIDILEQAATGMKSENVDLAGRRFLLSGKVLDLLGEREKALASYSAAIDLLGNDNVELSELMAKPYTD